MDTEPQEDVPKEFYDLVDRFIGLANELSAEYSVPQISAVLLYAAARYNTHCMVEADPDILENREEAVDYFTEQYRSMLEENVDKIT